MITCETTRRPPIDLTSRVYVTPGASSVVLCASACAGTRTAASAANAIAFRMTLRREYAEGFRLTSVKRRCLPRLYVPSGHLARDGSWPQDGDVADRREAQ